MHLAGELHVVDDLAAIRLQRAAEVAQLDARDARDDPVGDLRRDHTTRIVTPVPAPAADHVIALVDLLQEVRYIVRVVLHVAVKEDEHRATAVIDPRLHRGRLAEVAAKAHDSDPCVMRCDLTQLLRSAVTASVVDVKHLERGAQGRKHPHQPAVTFSASTSSPSLCCWPRSKSFGPARPCCSSSRRPDLPPPHRLPISFSAPSCRPVAPSRRGLPWPLRRPYLSGPPHRRRLAISSTPRTWRSRSHCLRRGRGFAATG